MSRSDANCVYVTSDLAEAEALVAWLREREIAADLETHLKESDGVVLTPFSSSDMASRLEIHVQDTERAAEVRQLIAQNKTEWYQTAEEVKSAPPQDMAVKCDACGQTSLYPGQLQGSVQVCPHCGAYLDIPGGEDEFDWSVVDETVSEYDQPDDSADEEESQASS